MTILEQRDILRKISRLPVDSSKLTLRVVGGVCYATGSLSRRPESPQVDLAVESERIRTLLRTTAGIERIVWEVKSS